MFQRRDTLCWQSWAATFRCFLDTKPRSEIHGQIYCNSLEIWLFPNKATFWACHNSPASCFKNFTTNLCVGPSPSVHIRGNPMLFIIQMELETEQFCFTKTHRTPQLQGQEWSPLYNSKHKEWKRFNVKQGNDYGSENLKCHQSHSSRFLHAAMLLNHSLVCRRRGWGSSLIPVLTFPLWTEFSLHLRRCNFNDLQPSMPSLSLAFYVAWGIC